MEQETKKSTKIILYIAFVLAVFAGVVLVNVMRANSQVKGIKVVIDYGDNPKMVSEKAIRREILKQIPTLESYLVKQVSCEDVSEAVGKNPFVERNNVSINVGGRIIVKCVQRTPIARIFYDEKEFYLDRKGVCVPLSTMGSKDVVVVSGDFHQKIRDNYVSLNVADMVDDSVRGNFDIVNVWKMVSYLYENPKYGVLFDQVYIDKARDIHLVPKLGDHTILVGDAEDLEQKLHNLWVLYKDGFSKVGWDEYSEINLKYKDQVICTKVE